MERVQIPEVILSSGNYKMPVIGMGTAGYPLSPPHHLTTILIDAIQAGYRHFDTASAYGTEEPVGRAVAEALDRGLIKSRDQIFITSKLRCSDSHHDLVLPAIHLTLRRLGLDYVDLYLIHLPVRMKEGIEGFEFTKEDLLPFDIKGTWEAMEECHRLGLAKSIGVSNFGSKKLTQLLQHATIPPAVNQVEMNVAWQQQKLREFCSSRGIHVSAWSPLAANGAIWGSLAVMESPILKNIAAANGKNVAQVALRWIYEQGVSVIVKSFNHERMKENLQIFDWKLTQDELFQIQQIPQRRGFTGEVFVHSEGPYKTLEDFWDDDA
ncbi:methylecgonone reductase-like [Cornus florida]|uniref:methylecgonone reductase-like n=1 Tax=Cornus florida TaxID=4283 RepID=UPI0028A1B255|nr:methylecgonone reductase-like [Cornus florida]